MPKLILYDLPSKGRCVCWSPNPWKTRMALNFKGLDYQTDWIEYPDIESRLSPHVPPNPPNDSPAYTKYTIPTMQFEDCTYIMDSKAIAERLEKDHPSLPLHLDSPLLPKVEEILLKARTPLNGVWMPLVPTNLLNPRSKEYFERTREVRVGKPLSELAKATDHEKAWKEATPGLKELGEVVKENGGPYVMGTTPSYADFVVVGLLHFWKVVDKRLYERVAVIEPALGNLYEASKQWLERDSH